MSAPLNLGAMARVRAAMEKLKPTPGDAKSDLLVVIASRLIMNSGNPVRISDVLNASSCTPADAWVARAFGKDVRLTAEMVDTALSRAKDHFQRAKDGRFVMKGWPLARRLECRINEDWGAEWYPDPRLGVTPHDLKPDRVPLAKRAREARDADAAPAPSRADGRGHPPREAADVPPAGAGAATARDAAEAVAPASAKRVRTASEKQRTSDAVAREMAAKRLERAENATQRTPGARSKGTKTAAARAAPRRMPKRASIATSAEAFDARTARARRTKPTSRRPRRPKLGTEEELDEMDADADAAAAAAAAARKSVPRSNDDVLGGAPANETRAVDVDAGDDASNVRFFGAARGSDAHRHRTYYDGFEVVTRVGSEVIEAKYVTGDVVYCLPGAEDEAMYVAQIQSVFADPNGQWVDCAWLERGSDLRALVPSDEMWREVGALDEEVFLTLAVNTNPVQAIEGKCVVLTEARWRRERAAENENAERAKRRRSPSPPHQETFFCRRALIGAPPGDKKKKVSGKSADSWAKAAVAGMFAPVTFEEGVGFRAVVPDAKKGKAKKGKGKR